MPANSINQTWGDNKLMSTNEKIPRVTSKIFASNAADGDIGQFGSALTGTKVNTDDISVIQGLPAYEKGWRGAVVSNRNYPTLQEMNGLQKTFSQQIAYILQNGMPEWDAGTTYFTDQFCRVGSMFYVSLQDNNLGNNPATTTGFWQVWNPAEGTYANTDLSNLSTTGQAVIDSKLSDTQLSNCILSLTEGSITPKSYTDVSFVNHGATYQSGTLSDFSASNFAILAKTMSNATAWTFTLPFTTGADVSGRQTIVAINNKDNCVIIDNGAIALVYNGAELKGDVGLSANTAYILEFIRTTTGYTVNVKQNETIIDTISVLSTSGFFGGKTVFLGNDQSGNYFKGSIGLATSSIYEGSTKYWQYSDDIDCQTVEVKGNFQLLMPNGRAANGTMTNVTKTISLDSLILYSPNGMGKTVLVTEDSELMARDSYIESYTEPDNPALNSIWYDKTDNELKQQLNTFPNYSVVGSPTISNGVISNFASGSVQVNQSFDLGSADTWEITIPVTTPSAAPEEDYESIIYDYNDNDNAVQNLNVVFSSSGAYKFSARRPDVYNVNNEVTVSTAYGVQTGDPEGENYQSGYVQVSGTAESYVTTGTQIYSDPTFESPLTAAPENTWTYTGQNVNNTQLVTGYVKEAGVTLVPAQTTVYLDSNCTTVQATASGTDYTYSGDTAISYICTLSQSASLLTAQTIKVGFNGSQYYLSVDENQQTYNSTDKVNGISSGYHISSTADPFSGTINLNGLTVSLNGNVEWEWNGVSSTTTDFASFVGAKIGKIEDNGTDITSATLDVPLTIAKDIDVVHNTGDEKIGGQKQFLRPFKLDCRESEHKTNAVMYLTGLNRTAGQTSYTGPSIRSYSPNYDMEDESAANQANAFGHQLLPLDKNGKNWGYFQFYNSYYNGSGQSVSSVWGVRRYVDGVLKWADVSLGISPNSSWFSFPKCNARPTTTSSAGTSNVDVITANYLSGTKGYVQFGSGLKIQWGRTSVSASTDRETITWARPFSNTNYACVLGQGHSNAWYNASTWRYAKTTTSVSVGKFNNSNAQSYMDVVAIGY